MLAANFEKALNDIGYKQLNTWQPLNKIARFNLTTNGSFFAEMGKEKSQYKYDKTHNLLYKRLVKSTGEVIKYCAILNVDEIISIEVLSPYSESIFNGNTFLR